MGDVSVEHTEVNLRDNVKTGLAHPLLIGADDANLVTLRLHGLSHVHGRDGGSVVFLSEDVTGKYDNHGAYRG